MHSFTHYLAYSPEKNIFSHLTHLKQPTNSFNSPRSFTAFVVFIFGA